MSAEACRCVGTSPGYPVQQGDLGRVRGVFTDLSSAEGRDPDTVLFRYKRRGEATVTLTYGEDDALLRCEAGVYQVDVPTDGPGPVYWRWESSGPTGVDEGQVTVLASAVA